MGAMGRCGVKPSTLLEPTAEGVGIHVHDPRSQEPEEQPDAVEAVGTQAVCLQARSGPFAQETWTEECLEKGPA